MKGFVYCGIVCAAAMICAIAVSIVVADPPASGPGSVNAVRPRQPGGLLGDQLGKYLTIEGVPTDAGKAETGTLLVDTVDGKKLHKQIPILIRNLRSEPKQRCVLKGYESGAMIGTPPAALIAAEEQGRSDVRESQAVWRWRPYFVALIVVEPDGLEISEQ